MPAGLLQVPDALDHRLVEVRVAAEPGQVDRRREALAGRREDRLVDRVVDEARRDLADDALAALAERAASRAGTGCCASDRRIDGRAVVISVTCTRS